MARKVREESPEDTPMAEEEEDVLMDEDIEQENDETQGSPEEEDEEEVIVSADKVEVISGAHSDQTAMTFCFKDEDHTLGNSLRYMINKNPEVDFCGYSIPHPSEAKMNVRIQTTDKTTAVEALRKGLDSLHDLCAHVLHAYEQQVEVKKNAMAIV